MIRYSNEKSGILEFDISSNAIALRFQSGDTYIYTDDSVGRDNLLVLQGLATKGRGLCSYLNRNRSIRNRYEVKLKGTAYGT